MNSTTDQIARDGPELTQGDRLESYYRRQARIYDATRWAFLFGRGSLLELLPDLPPSPRILEVGCGTGRNLQRMKDLFPDGQRYGVDISGEMLQRARNRLAPDESVNLMRGHYGVQELPLSPFDLIICSYSLTMTGTHLEAVLSQIRADLKPKGWLAVVDFDATPIPLFQRWMARNHVRMDGRLLPLLNSCFRPVHTKRQKAYLGAWRWFQFIGRRS